MASFKHRSTQVILILLRSAVFALVAFLILKWAWGKGLHSVGVGAAAAAISILFDLRGQIGKIDAAVQSDPN
jgi:hypothetical protein